MTVAATLRNLQGSRLAAAAVTRRFLATRLVRAID